jgi:hypothetical protein
MRKPRSKKSLLDAYRVPGFSTTSNIKGRFGDPTALVITLTRRQKKRFAVIAMPRAKLSMTVKRSTPETLAVGIAECTSSSKCAEFNANRVAA